jgi:hypothetical protein
METFDNQQVFADGITLAFFYAEQPVRNLFTSAYRKTGDVGIITKVRDKRAMGMTIIL